MSAWWNFAAVAEAEELYGADESCPWFMWVDRTTIYLPDGSSRWVNIPEPVIARNCYDNRDAFCGTSFSPLPAAQRYTLRLERWQVEQTRQRPLHTCWNLDDEPF